MTDHEKIMHEKEIIEKYNLLSEFRIEKAESAIKHINKTLEEININIQRLCGMTTVLMILMIGLLAKGFHWI